MAYPYQLERFVSRYLTNRAADVAQPSYGILEAVVDEHLSRSLQMKGDYIKLSFDYESAQEEQDAQYITYSSKFLEVLVDLAVRDHVAVIRYCPGKDAPSKPEERAAEHLQTAIKNVALVDRAKPYLVPCLRFKFKIAYLGDEREEELHHVWVDGHSGKQIPQYSEIGHIFFNDAPDDIVRPELSLRPLAPLLSAALQALEAAGLDRRKELAAQNLNQRDADLQRTDAYFGSMIADLQLKLSKAKLAKDDVQEKQLAGKLNAVMLQKQHHNNDINDKYRVRREVSLLDAALYMVPRWRVSVQVTAGRGQPAGSTVTLWWDEILRRFVPSSTGLPANHLS
ncbi:MAG TPA: hypothetical protein V6D22_06845 [Candidatus Obscuribacterales bacterium]